MAKVLDPRNDGATAETCARPLNLSSRVAGRSCQFEPNLRLVTGRTCRDCSSDAKPGAALCHWQILIARRRAAGHGIDVRETAATCNADLSIVGPAWVSRWVQRVLAVPIP